MTVEEIKKVLEQFIDEQGVIDLDKAAEELVQSMEESKGKQSESDKKENKDKFEELTIEDIAQMTPEEINEKWDEVQKVLKGAAK